MQPCPHISRQNARQRTSAASCYSPPRAALYLGAAGRHMRHPRRNCRQSARAEIRASRVLSAIPKIFSASITEKFTKAKAVSNAPATANQSFPLSLQHCPARSGSPPDRAGYFLPVCFFLSSCSGIKKAHAGCSPQAAASLDIHRRLLYIPSTEVRKIL